MSDSDKALGQAVQEEPSDKLHCGDGDRFHVVFLPAFGGESYQRRFQCIIFSVRDAPECCSRSIGMTVRNESERCSRSIGIGVRDQSEYARQATLCMI